MANPLLIREFYDLGSGGPDRAKLMQEMKEKSGKLVLPNVLLQMSETQNGNGRWYPDDILKREVSAYSKVVKEGRAIGELDHPENQIIELKNVSHRISEIRWDGKKVMGTVEVLHQTPSGQILEGLLLAGVRVGISSRGLGSLNNVGDKMIVEDDFQLICWDVVSDPSTPGAYLVEAVNRVVRTTPILSKDDRVKRLLDKWANEQLKV